MSTTHLVGPLVLLLSLDRAVQRCALCGEKLEDVRPSCVVGVSPSGRFDFPQLPEEHLVRVTRRKGMIGFQVLGHFREADLPDDFCLALVEP